MRRETRIRGGRWQSFVIASDLNTELYFTRLQESDRCTHYCQSDNGTTGIAAYLPSVCGRAACRSAACRRKGCPRAVRGTCRERTTTYDYRRYDSRNYRTQPPDH